MPEGLQGSLIQPQHSALEFDAFAFASASPVQGHPARCCCCCITSSLEGRGAGSMKPCIPAGGSDWMGEGGREGGREGRRRGVLNDPPGIPRTTPALPVIGAAPGLPYPLPPSCCSSHLHITPAYPHALIIRRRVSGSAMVGRVIWCRPEWSGCCIGWWWWWWCWACDPPAARRVTHLEQATVKIVEL